MKTPFDRSAYRRGFNSAKNPLRRRQCPYIAGSVAAESWNRGAYDRGTGLAPVVTQLKTQLLMLEQELLTMTDDMNRKIQEWKNAKDGSVAAEAYNVERHIRKLEAINREVHDSETHIPDDHDKPKFRKS